VITVERTDFISVPVTDMERSIAFYGETLGLPRVSDTEGWPEFQLGENVSIYLVDPTNIGREFEGPHTSSVALRVPDVEEARKALEAKGVVFTGETFDTGVCHMAIFADPDGNRLMLHRRYAPHED
jgi:catechol 2,3-dioxygenase-like lactoylglutathione lyase family enzyme